MIGSAAPIKRWIAAALGVIEPPTRRLQAARRRRARLDRRRTRVHQTPERRRVTGQAQDEA
jgi:hypothetical protein